MRRALVVAIAVALAWSCGAGSSSVKEREKSTKPRKHRRVSATTPQPGMIQRGYATWYGGSLHGGPTASGERFNKHALTAAHRKLPFGTRVRVTHRDNGKSVIVRINDRGPFGKKKRIIDVSEAAAKRLGMIDQGVAPVTIEVLGR
jgi:rare lipoprotein A